MVISELISKLEELKNKIGDVQVLVEHEGFGGYAIHTLEDVGESSLSSYDIDEDNYDYDVIRRLFPDWDGDEDTFEDFDSEVNCVEIKMGTMLYAS
jgi:hypothetical protein